MVWLELSFVVVVSKVISALMILMKFMTNLILKCQLLKEEIFGQGHWFAVRKPDSQFVLSVR